MAVYKCSICGMIFDEEKEGKKIDYTPKAVRTLMRLQASDELWNQT